MIYCLISSLTFYIIGCYLLSGINQHQSAKRTTGCASVIAVAIIAHAAVLYLNMIADGELLLSLGTGISFAGWVTALIYFICTLFRPVLLAGLIVLPIAGLTLVLGYFIGGDPIALMDLPVNVVIHILLSVPTYSLLCLGFAQAGLLLIQENRLKNPSAPTLLPPLPAIETMERYLFLFTGLGFTFMSVNLIAGMVANKFSSGSVLELNHHILLSLIAWSGFGCLLLGRKLAGWRGRTAAKWIISAFLVLFLAYFGTRFVNQVLIGG